MKVKMDGNYRYKNGGVARILCVDRPGEIMAVVVSMSDNGSVFFHSLEGKDFDDDRFSLVEIGQWDHIPIDAKVIVGPIIGAYRNTRHFACVNNEGKPTTFRRGMTSWTNDTSVEVWDFCEVAE